MSELKFRPRFRIETSISPEEAEIMLLEKLRKRNTDRFESAIVKGHMMLSIAREQRHFWSPHMDVSIDKDPESDRTLIRCLLAPSPTVWTMFMFFYALAGFGALVGIMIGGAQYSLNKTLWGFWLAGGATFLGLILFGIAQIGKGLSREEMHRLKAFIEDESWPN